ncbi:unknown [Alces alces papillomavirus 1]|uniref:Uncharacterized protein n=1 Tax=European elk papillomavirus TaxID=2885846 RepID=Q84257_PAPVE|nr:hypothetical protein EEPVgp03 [Alces alces papillomavirus 1]AAA66851.1 unknown [Alces alces papillomavirus 1]
MVALEVLAQNSRFLSHPLQGTVTE